MLWEVIIHTKTGRGSKSGDLILPIGHEKQLVEKKDYFPPKRKPSLARQS